MERNEKLYAKLQSDETSLMNNKKSQNSYGSYGQRKNSLSASMPPKITFEELNEKFENATGIFFSLADDEQTLTKKMKRLVRFKNEFEEDLENLDD